MEESYSSVDKIENLIQEERTVLLPQLKTIVNNLEAIRKSITNYVTEVSSLLEVDPELAAKDPLVSFQIIRRLSFDLMKIKNLLSLNFTESNETESILPNHAEVYGAAKSLVNIQVLYKLNATELANGKIGSKMSYTKLTANDCIFIAEQVKDSNYGRDAISWLQAEAYRRYQEQKNIEVPCAQHAMQEMFYIQEILQEREMSRKADLKVTDEVTDLPLWYSGDAVVQGFINFQLLCRGIKLLPPKYERDLKCMLSTREEKYFILMPVKMEIVSRRPPIILFYDVVSHDEIEYFKYLSRPLMNRSVVEIIKENEKEIYDTRLSQTAWLSDYEDTILKKLSQRVGDLTGLTCYNEDLDCEQLQVLNYGLGGEIYAHWDQLIADRNKDEIFGNRSHIGGRIATFMFYFSDVELGGYTAFPRAGVFVKPIKGSAVFWYNTFPNGTDDFLSEHGGCPVLYGSKWVGTRWIKEKSQMFRRSCPLDPLSEEFH